MSLSIPTPPSSFRRAVRCAPRRRRIAFVALIQCCIAAPAWSSHIGDDLTLDQQAVTVTDQMLGAMRQYEAAAPAQRANALARLTELATQRRERMLALLQRNPGLVSSRVLPAELRSRLPAQVQAQMERDVATSGVINARIEDDFPRGRSNQRFELVDAAGDRLELSVPDASENELLAMAGKRVRVAGVQFDRHLLVHDKGRLQLEAAGGTTSGSGGTVVAATLIQGNQNTLSILVNFSDAAVTCNATDVASRLFGATGSTVNNNYRESSGGLVGFSGQVVGPYTINYSASGSCDYLAWGSAAESAARAAGIDPSKYSRVNYVTPRNSTCGWSGLAYMPGRQSWVQSCSSTGVFSHELGHNLSFHHAATPSSEYGDGSDPMGGARVVNLNAANRVMAGWTSGGAVSDVTTGGSYALSTISSATATSSPQVLRIVKPDTREYYYISLREAVGLDAGLAATFINTVSVHRSTGTLPSKTYLLQNLAAGQTFTDSVNGITIANQAVSNSTATVAVTLGASACVRNAPTVAIAPASKTAGAGATLAYAVSVTNRNSAACGTSTYALTQALPAGFSGSLGGGEPGDRRRRQRERELVGDIFHRSCRRHLHADRQRGGLGDWRRHRCSRERRRVQRTPGWHGTESDDHQPLRWGEAEQQQGQHHGQRRRYVRRSGGRVLRGRRAAGARHQRAVHGKLEPASGDSRRSFDPRAGDRCSRQCCGEGDHCDRQPLKRHAAEHAAAGDNAADAVLGAVAARTKPGRWT